MWTRSVFLSPLTEYSLLQGGRCLSCQFRNTTTVLRSRPLRHYASKTNDKQQPTSPENKRLNPNPSPSPSQPPKKPNEKDIVPHVLDRPIGSAIPPQEGQNTGVDERSYRQRRDDFVSYDKHVERRQELTRQAAKPYFREWTNMRYHEGKTFLSNPRLFKRDKALYLPNMSGITLASPKQPQNTTSVLRGRISVVNMFSSAWAEAQVVTFTGEAQNPGLYEILKSKGGVAAAQKVDINVEENAFKAWLVRMFMGRMRKSAAPEQHERYFLVRKGLTDAIKETIGMMNSKVGYVYLLDENCRIRWAGSGPAQEDEIDALNRGVTKLLEERKISQESETPAETWTNPEKKPRVIV